MNIVGWNGWCTFSQHGVHVCYTSYNRCQYGHAFLRFVDYKNKTSGWSVATFAMYWMLSMQDETVTDPSGGMKEVAKVGTSTFEMDQKRGTVHLKPL